MLRRLQDAHLITGLVAQHGTEGRRKTAFRAQYTNVLCWKDFFFFIAVRRVELQTAWNFTTQLWLKENENEQNLPFSLKTTAAFLFTNYHRFCWRPHCTTFHRSPEPGLTLDFFFFNNEHRSWYKKDRKQGLTWICFLANSSNWAFNFSSRRAHFLKMPGFNPWSPPPLSL